MSASPDDQEQAEAIAVCQSPEAQSVSRMQQLLHGIRLAASDELLPADDLDRLAQLIENGRDDDRRRRA